MAQSGRKTERLCINWERAFDLYLNAIACDNEVLWVQATSKLAKLSKHAPEDLLARTVPILVELLRRIPSTDLSPSIQEAAAQCLKSVACQGEGRLAVLIGESGAIPSILSLLTHSDGSLRRALLKCLRNIVTFAADNRVIVATHGGLQIILNLLNTCSDDLKRYLLEILSALALLREVRRTILISGGVGFLVESARCGSMVSRYRAAQAIGLLGLVKRARRTLVDSGIFSVLLELVQVGDTSTKLVAANALGMISSHVDYIRPLANAGAIPLYAELLQGTEPMGKEIAEDVFCILALVEENAVAIVEHLVRILRGDNVEAKAASADVLWDLAAYKHLPSVVRDSGAIPVLVQLLEDQNTDVREKVSGAIAQLSYNEADRAALTNSGAIPRLVDMLQDESEEMRDNAAEALVNFSEDPSLGDRISDVLNSPSFQNMQERLTQIRASDAHLASSLRHMSFEQLTVDPALI
ncbi:protein ARABIDILLO 2 [Nicotiana tomentosiformis]|uniref:protein ARABIDILLO 2 n=1 Tax=Nicotiana tomentosiformis TaxID=4098 RepID=UPI00051B8A9C|nr:armadillo repeat-containing protein 4 [Nicotiana tomentosiformis]